MAEFIMLIIIPGQQPGNGLNHSQAGNIFFYFSLTGIVTDIWQLFRKVPAFNLLNLRAGKSREINTRDLTRDEPINRYGR